MRNPEKGLLIATYNKGKFAELRELLAVTGLELFSLSDVGGLTDVEETADTFAGNAELKARTYAALSGMWTLSDDSGLEVEALGGAPGVLSARYAGEGADDASRIAKLLGELDGIEAGARHARFVCAVAVADPSGGLRAISEGECRGTIAESPIGNGGFGYDPVFVPEGFQTSFGEVSQSDKDRISHRARAIEKIIPFLLDFKRLLA